VRQTSDSRPSVVDNTWRRWTWPSIVNSRPTTVTWWSHTASNFMYSLARDWAWSSVARVGLRHLRLVRLNSAYTVWQWAQGELSRGINVPQSWPSVIDALTFAYILVSHLCVYIKSRIKGGDPCDWYLQWRSAAGKVTVGLTFHHHPCVTDCSVFFHLQDQGL